MNTNGTSFWSSGSVPVIGAEALSGIIAAASDIAIAVSRSGQILSVLVNPSDASIDSLRHWEGRALIDVLTEDSIPKVTTLLASLENGDLPLRALELNHCDSADWSFPVRYSFHPFGTRGAFLMLGRDLRPIAETQQQLVQAQMSLEKGYEARREFDTRYRLLLKTVQDAVVFVSVTDGKIKDLNEPAAALLNVNREALLGSSFAQEFQDKRTDELIETLINAALYDTKTGVEMRSHRGRERIIVTPKVFRAAGERMLICRLSNADETSTDADTLSNTLVTLFDKGAEAFVFTTATGVIETCNDAFLDLVDVAHSVDVRGRNLAEFLGRGQIDIGVLIENARRTGQMRMYATKLVNDFGAKTPVEMSVTYFDAADAQSLGFVIRDVSRVEAIRTTPAHTSEDPNKNVKELVGSATLKEIVSETTDVIEKMCIETAVSLTRNNRVAAAEMLGLSRQSLYVKLRKYGLLNKDADRE